MFYIAYINLYYSHFNLYCIQQYNNILNETVRRIKKRIQFYSKIMIGKTLT